MLVLTRQKNQDIYIEAGGERMTIRIVEVRGDKVRLGFSGPQSFQVLRRELCEQVMEENRSATTLQENEVAIRLRHPALA